MTKQVSTWTLPEPSDKPVKTYAQMLAGGMQNTGGLRLLAVAEAAQ